jgi:hypothetical protein
MIINKKVSFNKNVIVSQTYASDEYDRFQIDSILYQKMYLRVSDIEWDNIIKELLNYKKHEMIVHIDNQILIDNLIN